MISLVISAPVNTYSGYGARSRDVVKALIQTGKYDITLLSQRWGNTRTGYLADHNEDEILSLIVPKLEFKPDVWIQISVPNEFQAIGKYSIGITAGIETTLCDGSWLEGINRMDLTLVSSEHAKNVFLGTKLDAFDERTKQKIKEVKVEKPIEVLFEGIDLEKYLTVNKQSDLYTSISSIKESFCFLSVGHWMQGDFGEDRKNIGYTIKTFLETYKNPAFKSKSTPALILKTHQVGTSIMDRDKILDKIAAIRKTVSGTLPNIYLLHGEVTDEEMSDLYNHPKVMAYVSHTKGEGFGRPLLEFAATGKPVIASGWSGQIDFLNREDSILLGGTLQKVHPTAVQKNMILSDALWFRPNDSDVSKAYKQITKHYKKAQENAKRQARKIKLEWTFDKMVELLDSILDKNLPEFPKEIKLTLPKLELPKLK